MPVIESIVVFASGLAFAMALGLIVRPIYFRNLVLAPALAGMSYLTFTLYLLHSQAITEYPLLFFLQVPVTLFVGPLLYFYIQSIMGEKDEFVRRDLLHFAPLLLAALYLMPYFLQSPNGQRQVIVGMMHRDEYPLLRAVLALGALVPVSYIGLPLLRIIQSLRMGNPAQKRIFILLVLLVIWTTAGIVGFAATIALSLTWLRGINLVVAAVIVLFYLVGQRYPYLMQYGTLHQKERGGEGSRSHLQSLDLEELHGQLGMIMDQEKLYCDEDLTLARLSSALGITPHQLSQFLNSHYHKNFNSFVNEYRITEARKLLIEEPERNTLSIAEAVGFNSYSAFHAAFRKTTGLSPAEYRRKELKNRGA